MKKSTYLVSKMDCPSEEQIIRMKLDGLDQIVHLEFNIIERKLIIIHSGELQEISNHLDSLNLGSRFQNTEQIEWVNSDALSTENKEKKLLWQVLVINFSLFLVEVTSGFISKSMGLFADSLDMLADSMVYGLALFAVGSSLLFKRKIAHFSGVLQLILALLGLIETGKKYFGLEEIPEFKTMIIISTFALVGNTLCLYLLQKSKSQEVHMRASIIFTSNDILINAGVIVAGALTNIIQSNIPDLIIGTIVFLLVSRGAVNILKL